MTIYNIDNVIAMIEECECTSNPVDTVWEYVNAGNNKTMYAVFTKACYNDIYESPYVLSPVLIWQDGVWLGEFSYLNR